ncbi:MAG: hypothetical protein A2233_04130 [Candidatus Kerfeldbacteria bacterium RIFOXYA2_FULL_38_24]|uniref:DUF5673 domain-containing protein n=1 Tax=Candidatus Kerfeldbacteria bacterium RIFOXYB2_FULL_38_14 TaxID=1798547 RepID=A0A1G2BC80_9BACT|nr:MAG: hypothetical protein A2233_04130 [Candidatus Kerfeldbacteria bacterium RIFOXYA2_FULL_38_24]OGY86754.1 MAG: hypothetical protein A2319_00860 [Candidatus Kerfeldbacteria bacterium RIFOXYB2_FULL_38_14]OGY89008.1 MAG: hypothetical protein A2458_04950 [Candidatus Kerfeldbacteria bacterium RIFOXYC2_FULL_38_9]
MKSAQPVISHNIEKGQILSQWSFPEYGKPQRGKLWYAVAVIFGGLLLWYALKDGNFLFALIILLFALIIITHHRTEPLEVTFTVYEAGMQIGDKFYRFREIDAFAVIYEPPAVKQLYLKPKRALVKREISIPLMTQNPVEVRSLLLDFVEEDLEHEEESLNDQLTRLFKL